MPKPPTLCPHGVLGKSKCSECKAEYMRLKRKEPKYKYKRFRAEYQAAYYKARKQKERV